MTFRIAIAQPILHRPGEDMPNVTNAVHASAPRAPARRSYVFRKPVLPERF